MYHKILVPLDGSQLAEIALPHAVNLAKASRAEVVLLHAVAEQEKYHLMESYTIGATEDFSEKAMAKQQAEEARAREYLAPLVEKLKAEGLTASSVTVIGPPAETITDYARDEGVDVIVMSTHGRSGVQRWLLGSVAEKVLHGATAPVLLVRAGA
jgi:nucleotide-binding universal stress UspA family protein